MKAKEFAKIEKKLLPRLPGFTISGKLIFISPVGDVLRGIYFENSSGTNDFYVRALFLPLFVPQDEINFVHGHRLRRGKHELWHADDPNLIENLSETIQDSAIPFLEGISTLAGVLERVKCDVESDWPRVVSHHLEELAYLLIKNGDYSRAAEALADLKQRLATSTTPWVVEQRNRAQLIEAKLSQSPAAALAQLEVWKAETIGKLGLERFR